MFLIHGVDPSSATLSEMEPETETPTNQIIPQLLSGKKGICTNEVDSTNTAVFEDFPYYSFMLQTT